MTKSYYSQYLGWHCFKCDRFGTHGNRASAQQCHDAVGNCQIIVVMTSKYGGGNDDDNNKPRTMIDTEKPTDDNMVDRRQTIAMAEGKR